MSNNHSFRNSDRKSAVQTPSSSPPTRAHSSSTSRTTNIRTNKDDRSQEIDNNSSSQSEGTTSTWRSVLDSIPSPSPPDRDGLEGWIRLFASIFIWFGAWGILDVLVSRIVSRRVLLCIVLGLFVVIGMVLILMTQNQEEP